MADDLPPMNSVPELLLRENRVSDLDNGTIYHALLDAKGNLTEAAAALEVSRTALKKRIEGVPALVQVMGDFREGIVDRAESNVWEDVRKGDATASRFVLSTIGKERGYTAGISGSGKAGEIEVAIRTFAEAPSGDK